MTAKKETHPALPALLAASAAFLIWSALLILRWWTFGFIDWDLALSAQMLWNIGHGNPHSSIMQVHFLGNHANLLNYPLAVLYRLFGHPVFLLLIKAFFCTFAAVPLYLLARPLCGRFLGTCLVLAFLLYPPLTHTVAFEFDFESLSPMLLLWLWYAFLKDRRRLFLAMALLCLLLKESLPLVVAMFCFVGLLTRKGKGWWAALFAGSLAYFAAAVFWLIPSHRGQAASAYWMLYEELGRTPGEVLRNFVLRPDLTASLLFTWNNLEWLFLLFAPTAGIALLGIDKVLIAASVFLQNMLSKHFPHQQILFHYGATPTPFIFIGALYGLKRLQGWFGRWRRLDLFLGLLLLSCALGSQILWGPWGFRTPEPFRFPASLTRDELDWKRAELMREVPPTAGVIASFHFMPGFSGREHLYGFHNVYMNRYRMSEPGRPYELPPSAEYVLVDMNDPQMVSKLTLEPKLANNIHLFYHNHPWDLVEVVESMLLLRRGAAPSQGLYEVSTEGVELPPESYWLFRGGIRLLKPTQPELARGRPGGTAAWSMTWQAESPLSTTYGLSIAWFSSAGEKVKESFHPLVYRIYPPPLWTPGRLVREHLTFLVPAHCEPGRYRVLARLVDEPKRELVLLEDQKASGSSFEVVLGEVVVE